MSLGRKKRPLHLGRAYRRVVVEERGAELVEFAIVLPTLLMPLIGIIWLGRAYNIYETITRAAREGARYGAAPTRALCATKNTLPDCTSQVKPVVDAAVKAAGLAANEKNFSCQNGVTLGPRRGSAGNRSRHQLRNTPSARPAWELNHGYTKPTHCA